MPVNLELKVKVPTFANIKKILKEIDAKKISLLQQKDVYFKVENGLLKLRSEEDRQTLIYYNRNESSKNRWSDFKLLRIKDKTAEKFLSHLFEAEAIVKKKRELYMYDNTRIHLDTVEELGAFLELETLLIGSKEDAKKRFKHIKQKLELNEYEELRTSYRSLLLAKARR